MAAGFVAAGTGQPPRAPFRDLGGVMGVSLGASEAGILPLFSLPRPTEDSPGFPLLKRIEMEIENHQHIFTISQSLA